MLAILTFLLASVFSVLGKDIIITVGANGTNDPLMIFSPPRVSAVIGDNVIFNFTSGNHSAVQATFVAPCVPAHVSNISLNGFDSGPRPVANNTPQGTVNILSVPILSENFGQPFWFYDANFCAGGAVGVINSNESSTETLAGFIRNAQRLNGTNTTTSSSGNSSQTSTSSPPEKTSSASHGHHFIMMPAGLGALVVLGALSLVF